MFLSTKLYSILISSNTKFALDIARNVSTNYQNINIWSRHATTQQFVQTQNFASVQKNSLKIIFAH